jgi:serine/threonine protein kinase
MIKALFLITTVGVPSLQNPAYWSNELLNFLSRCLKVFPSERSTSFELLNDPFADSTYFCTVYVKLFIVLLDFILFSFYLIS